MAQRTGKKEFGVSEHQPLMTNQQGAQPQLHWPCEVPFVAEQAELLLGAPLRHLPVSSQAGKT